MNGRFASRALAMVAFIVLVACSASLPGPSQVPSTVPSTLDTGTPSRSNLAWTREVPVAGS